MTNAELCQEAEAICAEARPTVFYDYARTALPEFIARLRALEAAGNAMFEAINEDDEPTASEVESMSKWDELTKEAEVR